MIATLEKTWRSELDKIIQKPKFKTTLEKVKEEYRKNECFPPVNDVFNAFNLCPYDNLKVVVLGQDPYINKDQAHGLSFSVKDGTSLPPSLKNIFKELEGDIGIKREQSDLSDWAAQGVLMINGTFTVQKGISNSHKNIGWLDFTKDVINHLNTKKSHIVYIAWGSFAQKLCSNVDNKTNLVLSSAHPSPLSSYRGFFGSNHFSKTNEYLRNHKLEEIKWC